MSKHDEGWRRGEVLAYTESDGPGRPPSGSPTWVMGTLVGVLGVTSFGLISSDTLCAEHRAWVEYLATVGITVMVWAFVSLLRGRSSAPVLTLLASSLGVAIGLVDAVHEPTRGRVIALAFAMTLAGSATLLVRSAKLRRWDQTVSRSLRAAPEVELAPDLLSDRSEPTDEDDSADVAPSP
jgi:hypothetical protein